MRRLSLLLFLALAIARFAAAAEPTKVGGDGRQVEIGLDLSALPSAVSGIEGVEKRIFRDGRVYIAGQPSAAALKRLHELGVTAVVCLRTPGEMSDRQEVPFDEKAEVEKLGMEFVHLPIGGDATPYRPEVLDRFADVLARHRGPVLLHCTIAWRASYVWTAYLVREQRLPLDQALARGRAIALQEDPLGRLLGRPMKLVFADAARTSP